MTEFYSRAIVLEREDLGETDSVVHLFTEKYGKVVARARSLRKITSKSSAHLQLLRIVQVRFVSSKKADGGFIIMDVLWDDSLNNLSQGVRYDLFPVLRVINKLIPEFQSDPQLWILLETALREPYTATDVARALLHILGFDAQHAHCFMCEGKSVGVFVVEKDLFLCKACTSQLPTDAIVLEI